MFELWRADIGFGKLIVDDVGITRKRLVRTQRMRWDEILGYRLGAAPQNATGDLGRAVGGFIAAIIDFNAARRGAATRLRLRCELLAAGRRMMVNWRFAHVHLAIDEVLRRVGPRLLESSRRELAMLHAARFGSLVLTARDVQWHGREPLAHGAVEQLEIIDNTPLELVIARRGHGRAYARFALDAVPNVLTALDVAEELGYRVRGRELLLAGM